MFHFTIILHMTQPNDVIFYRCKFKPHVNCDYTVPTSTATFQFLLLSDNFTIYAHNQQTNYKTSMTNISHSIFFVTVSFIIIKSSDRISIKYNTQSRCRHRVDTYSYTYVNILETKHRRRKIKYTKAIHPRDIGKRSLTRF